MKSKSTKDIDFFWKRTYQSHMSLFVAKRSYAFENCPPAWARHARVLSFYGTLSLWVELDGERGWGLPLATRESGDTIVKVAARAVALAYRSEGTLDLLGAVEGLEDGPTYVYLSRLRHPGWLVASPLYTPAFQIGAFVNRPQELRETWMEDAYELAHTYL